MVEGQPSKRIRTGGETSAWSELNEEVASTLSKNVVSLALSNGHTVFFACSGMAVERVGYVTRFLTSASLVTALNDNRKDHGILKIEVCYEDNVVTGFLGEYNLCHNIAAVNVMTFPHVHIKLFNNRVDFLPCTKVVALGRGISGKLMTTGGILTGNSSEHFLTMSTCKISQVCEGGPLFDFDGNFVGMNLLSVNEGTVFLPVWHVYNQLTRFKSLGEIKFRAPLNLYQAFRIGERLAVEIPDFYQEGEVHRHVLNEDQFGDLESLGYPKPSLLNDGMVLVNTFEEPFGDIFDKGVWSKLSEKAVSNIRENVVALASFTGKRRIFACTGFCIDWNGSTIIVISASLITNPGSANKIDENLRIEVLLPSQERKEGTLQHYNLQYNVALVSVKDFCATHPAMIQHLWDDRCDVVAVGCCFESGKLVAAKRGTDF
ncbi:hypothetical protein QOZ80_1BG0097710 [Eleusine coracana subsp. coracana]|nr:hypothetical protein QOZ80_1BG0097710 [Eleusine coracana subsp. coracana]